MNGQSNKLKYCSKDIERLNVKICNIIFQILTGFQDSAILTIKNSPLF